LGEWVAESEEDAESYGNSATTPQLGAQVRKPRREGRRPNPTGIATTIPHPDAMR
jgi:hypothetical protein